MKEWFISGWIHLLLGFAIGWLVFKQPQWALDLLGKAWSWVKSKVGLG